MAIHAHDVLLPAGWRSDVRLKIAGGRIASIETGVPPQPGDERHHALVAAMPNLHSHAFQRAMAGLAEMRGPTSDSFWTWRERMYRFALAVEPDDLAAIAAQLYVEMLESGFSRAGEFHYLHHARDGRPYADVGEMAVRIAEASEAAGIALTLLPVFYAHGGFGGRAPLAEQRRFICDIDLYARLVERSRQIMRPLAGSGLGVAPHSLRAVTMEELSVVAALATGGPCHIHVAEQEREVQDCLAWGGARPVETLLDGADVDARWCLVHATHMTEAETRRLARSGAVAGLCPITEANLGDGVFPAPVFMQEGGRYGIGSDSNVQVGVGDELRQLEYSQRIATRSRNVMRQSPGSTGRALYESALSGGNVALGVDCPGIAARAPADLVSLDLSRAPGISGDAILDGWIFARSVAVDCVWVAGHKRVVDGRHVRREPIARRFAETLQRLLLDDRTNG